MGQGAGGRGKEPGGRKQVAGGGRRERESPALAHW